MAQVIEKGKRGGWRPNSGRKSGFVGYWLGKKRPEMVGNKFKIPVYGEANIFSKLKFPAEQHPNWKGGTWLFWRKKALERDNYTCQKCLLHDPEVMLVDHIIPNKKTGKRYNENNHDLNNLQTLCANCHLKKTREEKKEGAHRKSYYSL